MGLFNSGNREEQAHYIYLENERFQEICEKTKEKQGFVMNPRFGLSGTLRTFGVYDRRIANKT